MSSVRASGDAGDEERWRAGENERKRAGRARAREVARDFLARGDGTGWFEAFYRDAGGDATRVPWADREGHPLLSEWLEGVQGGGRPALVVGCGLGEDAELCARAGFEVAAFDVSPTAIELCARAWPGSRVRYQVADLFAPPAAWFRAFEFVLEIYTLQALPPAYRREAIARVADFVAPGGRLLVVTMGRGDEEARDQIPWPLSRAELAWFEQHGLRQGAFRELFEDDGGIEGEPVPRWRVEYARAT